MKGFAHVGMAISDEMILLWRVAAILLAPDHERDASLIIPRIVVKATDTRLYAYSPASEGVEP